MMGNTNAKKRGKSLAEQASAMRKQYAAKNMPNAKANSITVKAKANNQGFFKNTAAALKEDLSYAWDDVKSETKDVYKKASRSQVGKELKKAYNSDISQSVVLQVKGVGQTIGGISRLPPVSTRAVENTVGERAEVKRSKMLNRENKDKAIANVLIAESMSDPAYFNARVRMINDKNKANATFKAADEAQGRVADRVSKQAGYVKSKVAEKFNVAQIYAELLPEIVASETARTPAARSAARMALDSKVKTSQSLMMNVAEGRAHKEQAAKYKNQLRKRK